MFYIIKSRFANNTEYIFLSSYITGNQAGHRTGLNGCLEKTSSFRVLAYRTILWRNKNILRQIL